MRASFGPLRPGVAILAALVAVGGVASADVSGPNRAAKGAQALSDRLAPASRPALRIFRDRDGLPENAPVALAFDPRGILWAGTEDGLGSYDGRLFKTFNAPRREVSNYFRAVFADSSGAIWCGLQDGGLARLAGGRWTTFPGAGLPSDRIDAITESVAGPSGGRAIWVATGRGVARAPAPEGHETSESWTVFGEKDGLPSERVGVLLDGHDDDGSPALYAGTANGLAVFKNGRFVPVAGAPPGGVVALHESEEEGGARSLWVAIYDVGLARRTGGAWTLFTTDEGVPETRIRSIAETTAPDGARTIWIGSDSGLLRFDGHRFLSMLADALPSTTVWSLLPEPLLGATQTLWIGVDGGLARVHLGGFRSFPGEAAAKSTYAIQVTRGSEGETLWVGTRGAGLERFDGKTWTRFDKKNGLPDDTIYAFAELDEGAGHRALWVGAQGGGIGRYEGGVWTHELEGTSTVRQLHSFTGDDGNPVLDAATGGRGVLRRTRGEWSYLDTSTGLPTNNVFDVVETRASPGAPATMWVATDGAGIARRDGTGPWSRLDRKSSPLLSDSVLALHVVKDGGERGRDLALWAGTQGGGVSVLDLRDPDAHFVTFTEATRPALPNDTVYEVKDDGHGRVYLFTNKGVARLTPRAPTADDPAPFAVRTFTTEDGLPANECNGGGAFVDDRGRIWAGTVSGVAFLDPAEEVLTGPGPQLDLAPTLARTGAPLVAGASLRHDQNDVAFDYAMIRLFRGEETTYRTQLVGLEPVPGAWSREARHEYPALPEGSYVFRAWARDFEGREVGPVAVPFRVKPPPWLTWWAMALYALGLGASAYAIARYRLYALERRNALLETGIVERTAELARKVSELAVSESRARAAEEDARRADRAKSLFLSTMSHELRTPLNAILGFSQLLVRDRALSRANHDDVEVIQRSGEHLLGLINDVLSIAKIEAGMIVLDVRPFRLEETLRAAAKIVGARARAKGLRLLTETGPGLPPAVRGDEGKVRQILLNLLGNAVKFTARGEITARASWERGRAVLEVTDTGPGIAEAELATLFAPFVQSATGRSAAEGTGLGLAISRSYAQRMGGNVSATSTVGVGTTFRCEIALEAADEAEAPVVDRRVVGLAQGSGPFRVLVTDDSAENRRLLVRILAMDGFEVREAATGEEAVRMCDTFSPDIVFMDVHMPGLDGAATTRAIRDRERARDQPRPPTKIVALSASVLEGDREALLRGGCDAFLSKPYREGALFEALETVLGARFDRAGDSGGMGSDADAATPERLQRLPEELKRKLYRAARGGDLGGARLAVGAVAATDPELAESLRVLVDAFLLEEIEARMRPDGSEGPTR